MAGIQFNREHFNAYHRYMTLLCEGSSDMRHSLMHNLRRAIKEEIPPKVWQSMELYYVEQIKMADIALKLGVNVSTVSRNIKRGRDKLSRCMQYGAKELLDEVDSYMREGQ